MGDQEGKPSEGVMLVMSKSELGGLRHEFPQYRQIWKKEAERRRHNCEHLLEQFVEGRLYKELAITTIQRQAQHFLEQKRRRKVAPPSHSARNIDVGTRASNGGMLSHLNKMVAASAGYPLGASRPSSSAKGDFGALHEKVQAQGKQLQQALEGIHT